MSIRLSTTERKQGFVLFLFLNFHSNKSKTDSERRRYDEWFIEIL